MIAPGRPADEAERRQSLLNLGILDTPTDPRYERIVRRAADQLGMPIAYVSLVDDDRQWLKANLGMPCSETSRDVSFCGHAILDDAPLIVPDAREDERFADNPMVVGEPHLRFYAGVPLKSPSGFKVGTLCVADTRPRELSTDQIATLRQLAAKVEQAFTATVLTTLVVTDLVNSTRLVETLGDARASDVFARQDRIARDLLEEHHGREIDKTDGFLMLFERPVDAVGFAVAYHAALAALAGATDTQLATRVGIHLGELVVKENVPEDVARGAKPIEVEGLAKPFTARLMSLAGGGQTLMSGAAFDMARRAMTGAEARSGGELEWLAHGPYLLKGVAEPVDVFEVGVVGQAPLEAPADTEKARRVDASGTVVGWRPAAGQEVPERPRWTLQRKLGEGGFGEAWLGEHGKTGAQRVFKFCYDRERLQALQREVTLFRLMKEVLGDRHDITRILDWHFDTPPYFLEVEYSAGGNLLDWARERGGVASLPLEDRLEIVAQAAEALAAAHSVGVLHKDLKPENLLVDQQPDGSLRIRLTDFGIGEIVDRERISAARFTVHESDLTPTATTGSTGLGTQLYVAPELLENKPASIQADIYALGVLLYQMVLGDLTRVLAPGWRREVGDELLCADIARMVDGDPERRLGNALRVAESLRALEERRRQAAAEKEERARQEYAARRRRMARVGVAAISLAALGLLVGLVQARAAQRRAAREAETANRVVAFLEGVFRVSDPSEARGNEITARELLDRGAERIRTELAGEPAVRGRLLATMGSVYAGLGLFGAAEELQSEALDVRIGTLGSDHTDVADSLYRLGNLSAMRDQLDAAEQQLRDALRIREATSGPESREVAVVLVSLGRLLHDRGELVESAAALSQALEIQERIHGRQSVEVAGVLYNLGILELTSGDFEEAERHARESADIYRELFGDPHMGIAAAVNLLAGSRSAQGDEPGAELLAREVLRQYTALVPEDHPALGRAWLNLGAHLHRQDKLEEALEAYTRSLAVTEAGHGTEHRLYAGGLANMASLQERRGDLGEAERLYRAALEVQERVFGESHFRVARTVHVLGGLMAETGRPAEGERLGLQAVELFEQNFGPDHWEVANARIRLGMTQEKNGRLAEAEASLRKGVSDAATALGDSDHRVIEYGRYLGEFLIRHDRCVDALEVLEEARRGAVAAIAPELEASLVETMAPCRSERP